MLQNTQCNPHTVTVRYISVRVVANSCSRRLFCEYADRYTCAVVGVPMVYVYDLSVLGRERKTAALSTGHKATNGVQLWALVSYVKAAFGGSEVTLF